MVGYRRTAVRTTIRFRKANLSQGWPFALCPRSRDGGPSSPPRCRPRIENRRDPFGPHRFLFSDDAWRLADRGPDQSIGGKEALVDRAHVDVPALALRRLDARQIAHRRLSRLHVGRNRSDHEQPLERIDGYTRIRHWTIPIRNPVDVRTEQSATAIVGVDVRVEPDFRVLVQNGAGIDRIDLTRARGRLYYVHVAHLPSLRARARAAIRRASDLWRVLGMDRGQHVFLAKHFVVVLFGLRIESRVVIRIPRECGGPRGGRRTQD